MKAYELNWPQRIVLALAGAVLLSATIGCSVKSFTGNTVVRYKVTAPNGVITEASWENNKDEQGVDVRINPLTGEVTLRVEKSGTPSEAVTAAAAAVTQGQGNIGKALDLVKDLAIKGATKGAVP